MKVINAPMSFVHYFFKALLCCAVSTGLLGSLSAQEAESAADSAAPTAQVTVEVEDVVADSAIADRLQQIFDSTEWFSDLRVTSENGIVTLTGTANSAEHRQWAADTARRTQDVIAVINQLENDTSVEFQSSQEVVLQSLDSLWRDFLLRSPLLIAALLVLGLTAIVTKVLAWLLVKTLDKRHLRVSLKDLVYQLTAIGVWIVGLLVATVVAFPGMTPSKALTVLGLGSVAIGFAFKDIFENFFAGILILWRYPFDRGDFISCDGLVGKVEQITIRNTLIRRLDGELVIIPNATVFKTNVEVLTSQPQRRVRIVCGVAYGEDVDQAREVIRGAVQGCDTVQGVRTVEVFAQEFADSSVNFEVAWWTGSKPIDIRRSRDQVIAAIKRELDAAGIEIPFPYRTLTFQDPDIAAKLSDKDQRQREQGTEDQ